MRVGILGAGRIAVIMAATINGMKEAQAYGVASRDLSRAQEFAKENEIKKAYGSYEEMLSDEDIDLVYVATPHSHHAMHAKMCIEYGKPALVEKAFCTNEAQAKEVFDLAKEKGVLVTEAIWTRYMPSRGMIDELIASGIIGEVKSVEANLCYAITDKPRLIDPNLAGGALLDVGVYTLNFASMILGDDYKHLRGYDVKFKTGVDAQDMICIEYNDGCAAILHAAMNSEGNRMGHILGSKGYIEVTNINNPEEIRVYDNNHKLIKALDVPAQITGYEYEVLACKRAIENNELECFEMPHAQSLEIMRQMDALRQMWGIKYPCE